MRPRISSSFLLNLIHPRQRFLRAQALDRSRRSLMCVKNRFPYVECSELLLLLDVLYRICSDERVAVGYVSASPFPKTSIYKMHSPSSRSVLGHDVWLSRHMPMIAFGGRVISTLTGESQDHVFGTFLDEVLHSRKADLR